MSTPSRVSGVEQREAAHREAPGAVRGGGAGDLMCRVAVETPVNLSKRQRELLEEFRSSLEGDDCHSPITTGFFDGVKRLFGDL